MKYFKAHELVCPHVYHKFGERGISFADERLLKWLEWFREAIDDPVYVNNYEFGGPHSQRGYRCYFCQIVKDKIKANVLYLSAHTRFQAVDFNVKGLTESEVLMFIQYFADEMPCNIRIELGTDGWNHVDVASNGNNKITYFNA